MTTQLDMILIEINSHKLRKIRTSKYHDSTSILRELYHYLKCDLIDITKIKIGDRYFDAIVDDEGLLKNDYVISLFENDKPRLVGNIILTKYSRQGNNKGLTEEEIKYIDEHQQKSYYTTTETVYKTNQFKAS